MDQFLSLNYYFDVIEVRRWSEFAVAHPSEATRLVLGALTDTGIDDRKRIEGDARREMVWTLVRLAWNKSCFRNAVISLALLGEAENETWANNASSEFIAKFDVGLGGTATPYMERLPTLDEVISLRRLPLTKLAVKALARVHNVASHRQEHPPISNEPQEPEWRPSSGAEYGQCINEAITRLTAIAIQGEAEVKEDLVKAATNLVLLLRENLVRALVSKFFEAVRVSYPETREVLRKAIWDIIRREEKLWKKLSVEELAEIKSIHGRFEDASLGGRLQQFVGQGPGRKDETTDLSGLAAELIADQKSLSEQWGWLTSGEAGLAWELGEALAAADVKIELIPILTGILGRGRDLRVLGGYLSVKRKLLGDAWLDHWLEDYMARNTSDAQVLIEVAWRCGPTERSAYLVKKTLLEQNVASHLVGALAYGRWGEALSFQILFDVLTAMAERGHGQTAIEILQVRLEKSPEEFPDWEKLALGLVTKSELIRGGHSVSDHWAQMARRLVLVPGHARVIAAAIFREQKDRSDRSTPTWFAEHSDANGILYACADADPAGFWLELRPYLLEYLDAYMFTTGFPVGLLEKMPVQEVDKWIAENPEERASLAARLLSLRFDDDQAMPAQLIAVYGDNENVGDAFFSAKISYGVSVGPISKRWSQLATELREVAGKTKLAMLRRWAEKYAAELEQMAERDRMREEERELRS